MPSRIKTADAEARLGVLYGLGGYLLWGLSPIYWKMLAGVPPMELLCHRVVWSLAFVAILLSVRRHWRWLAAAVRDPVTPATFVCTSCLVALNWLVYIWAVNADHIVDVSLGYFANPLLSVVLGTLFLGERMRRLQWGAIGLAAAGVAYMTIRHGTFPWIGAVVALTFALYGLIRKRARLGALEGLSLESMLLLVPALAYLAILEGRGTASFVHAGARTSVTLAFAWVVTALPLLWFAHAAKRVTLATVGIMQYVTPTMQFLLGVLVYGEALSRSRLAGFSLVWAAVALYAWDGVRNARKAAGGACPVVATMRGAEA